MDRSRSKRYYYDQDYESETLNSRSRPRYSNSNNSHHYGPNYPRRSGGGSGAGGAAGRKVQDSSVMVTTSYRILCHDVKAGGVIGKSGSIIKAIRQHTGAWINVHEVIPGDEERIIEISDTRRRDPDGRMPNFSPAQEALFLIHDRILETEMVGGYGHNAMFGDDGGEEYGGRGGNGNRMVTRLVVSRMHVGSLLGKGGKIIEQMRIETKTHIRVLPRDHSLPRCVAMSEEIVQIVGDMNNVKNALAIISSRLRESQHRDRTNFSTRQQSPDRFAPMDEDFNMHTTPRRSSAEGPVFGSRYSKGNNYPSRSSGYAIESGRGPAPDVGQSYYSDDIVFRILCPYEKVERVVGERDGIVDLLQNEVGVNVEVGDPVIAGSDEHVIVITSDEGPDDELFPAQEALLHIQTRIVDLVPEKENIVATRLLLRSDEIGCLGLKNGSNRSMVKMFGANVEILPREGLRGTDEIVQIVGEIRAAREALVEITSRIRSYIYRDLFEKDAPETHVEPKAALRNNMIENQAGNAGTVHKMKDVGPFNPETLKPNESTRREDTLSALSRISVPLVTRSTLEVVLPPHTASKLKARKLTLISEISGASVKLIEDRPDVAEKVIQISGTPEQAERAQSLLQGFILSTEEDGP